MSEPRYPNEGRLSRCARPAVERRARACRKSEICGSKTPHAPSRRAVERGLRLPVGQRREVGQRVKFSELFGDKNTCCVSFMFGPNWDNPCLSCTSLVDGFDRAWYQVAQNAAFVAIAKAPAARINAWAKQRLDQIRSCPGSSLPIKPITNARATQTICSGR